MIRLTTISIAVTGFLLSPIVTVGQCTLTSNETELIVRAIINSRMWSPALAFTMSEQSYSIRWVRLGSALLVANASALPSDIELSGVDVPIYELGRHLPSLLAVRRIGWSEGTPDFLSAYARRLTGEGQEIEGPCTSSIPETALQLNRPLNQMTQMDILTQVTPRLQRALTSSFVNGGSCKGNFVPPWTLESRAVGFLSCTTEGVSEDFYYWAFLSPEWQVLSVYVGFDRPGHKTGRHAYDAVRNRAKLFVSLKFP